MPTRYRQFSFRIWGLALGYFAFYLCYSALIRTITTQRWPGLSSSVSGFRLLPATIISTALILPVMVFFLGWWKHVSRRQFRGRAIPFPGPLLVLSGLGTAIIIGTTTLAYTFNGVSILLALLLLRTGVLIIAPAIDLLFRRRVRWFSWLVLILALTSAAIALLDVNNYQMTTVAALTIGAYLSGYLLRLPCMNKLAKCEDEQITYSYFVDELMVAVIFLIAIPAILALIGKGPLMMDLRLGFTDFFESGITPPGLLVGALYAGLYFFGTLIYLDRRENTFCVPLNRCSSLLSGIVATYALTILFNQPPPSLAQLGSSSLTIVALLLLSPLHHVERYPGKLRQLVGGARGALLNLGRQRPLPVPLKQTAMPKEIPALREGSNGDDRLSKVSRTFLFVCSGNTCRSPMAAAIGNAELAARFRISATALGPANLPALSAGISADIGAPMAPEARQALHLLGVSALPHKARNLTDELAYQVERIFCMTRAHRNAVIDLVPAAAAKTQCLDPNEDIEDPMGKGMAAYVNCARRIHDLVKLRFDEIGLVGE
jgi:protein-tyrosine-phosphatase